MQVARGDGRARGRFAASGPRLETCAKPTGVPYASGLLVVVTVLAITHVAPGHPLHQRLTLEEAGGGILESPRAPKVLRDLHAPLNERSCALDIARPATSACNAEHRALRARPNKGEVILRVRGFVVPLHEIDADGGAELLLPIYRDNFPTDTFKGAVNRPSARTQHENPHFCGTLTKMEWASFELTRFAEQVRQRELPGSARREAQKQAEFEAACEESDYFFSSCSGAEIELRPESTHQEEVSILYAERSTYVRN